MNQAERQKRQRQIANLSPDLKLIFKKIGRKYKWGEISKNDYFKQTENILQGKLPTENYYKISLTKRIIKYWQNNKKFVRNPKTPRCFCCRDIFEEWEHLEKCHLHAKVCGGSMDPSNLVLMCNACHGLLDSTFLGEEHERNLQIAWIKKRWR